MMLSGNPPYDLRIQIYFEPLDGQPHAPDGPGWYIAAIRRGEDEPGQEFKPIREVVPRVRIPNDEIVKIAKVVDRFVHGKPLNWTNRPPYEREDVSLEQAVLESIEAGKHILQSQVEQAERAVAQLERLRQLAKEFDAPE